MPEALATWGSHLKELDFWHFLQFIDIICSRSSRRIEEIWGIGTEWSSAAQCSVYGTRSIIKLFPGCCSVYFWTSMWLTNTTTLICTSTAKVQMTIAEMNRNIDMLNISQGILCSDAMSLHNQKYEKLISMKFLCPSF